MALRSTQGHDRPDLTRLRTRRFHPGPPLSLITFGVVLALAVLGACSSETTGDDGATPLTPNAEPGAGPELGFSPGAGLRDQDDALLAGDLVAMARAGASWIRLDIDWSVVEPEPGRPDWSSVDRLIDAAVAADLEVLGMLAYAPAWARPPGAEAKHPPIADEAFVRFATEAVARYQPRGVTSWQVWNEPNSELFWSTGPDPDRYGRLLAATAAAIRSVDPDATIVSGGLAPALDRLDDGWLSPATFLRGLLDAGVMAEIDAVGVHPYSFPARPLDEESAEWNSFLRLPDLHRMIVEADAGPDRLWITEYGAPTGTHQRAVSEERQATLLIDALDAAERWPWLGPVFLYTLRDYRQAPEDLEWNYGVLAADGSPKAAWAELVAREARRAESGRP